jgi:hypothetical protein
MMMMTQATITTSKLSLVAGAALMLAAFPAMAQTNTQTGNMNEKSPTSQGQSTHQGMSPHHAMHAGRTDASQNGAVDRLNEQSLQAAQQGQNFAPGGSSAAPPSDNMGQGNMGQGNMGQSGGGMNQPGSGTSSHNNGKM